MALFRVGKRKLVALIVVTCSLLAVYFNEDKRPQVSEKKEPKTQKIQIDQSKKLTTYKTISKADIQAKSGVEAVEEYEADVHYEQTMKEDDWVVVETEAPDMKVVGLSEKLLGDQEEKLQFQISSTSASIEDYPKLYKLALKSKKYKTKYLSVYALGETYDPKAQKLLVKLYPEMDEKMKKEILGWLIPDKGNDKISVFLTKYVLHDEKDEELQLLAMNSLAAMDLENSGEASEKILEKLPPMMREEYKHVVETIKKAEVSHDHKK